jgi:cytidine deaminase
MPNVSNTELIARAASVVNARRIGDYVVGDVGCALVSETGSVYLGVCIDAGSGIGFCAEHSAIAAMVTAGEFKIQKIVAVWKNEEGAAFVLSPCGRCRELMRQIHPDNLAETEVILGTDQVVRLADLLPYPDYFSPTAS